MVCSQGFLWWQVSGPRWQQGRGRQGWARAVPSRCRVGRALVAAHVVARGPGRPLGCPGQRLSLFLGPGHHKQQEQDMPSRAGESHQRTGTARTPPPHCISLWSCGHGQLPSMPPSLLPVAAAGGSGYCCTLATLSAPTHSSFLTPAKGGVHPAPRLGPRCRHVGGTVERHRHHAGRHARVPGMQRGRPRPHSSQAPGHPAQSSPPEAPGKVRVGDAPHPLGRLCAKQSDESAPFSAPSFSCRGSTQRDTKRPAL